jgi:hypothetical protein
MGIAALKAVIEYLPDDALALCFSSSQLRLAWIVQPESQASDIWKRVYDAETESVVAGVLTQTKATLALIISSSD